MLKLTRIAILAMATALSSSAFALGPTGTVADYGSAVTSAAAERSITITPSTRWVNVVNGETVTFIVGAKSFSWHIDTYSHMNGFDLQTIAPKQLEVAGVRVQVSPNPTYHGS